MSAVISGPHKGKMQFSIPSLADDAVIHKIIVAFHQNEHVVHVEPNKESGFFYITHDIGSISNRKVQDAALCDLEADLSQIVEITRRALERQFASTS